MSNPLRVITAAVAVAVSASMPAAAQQPDNQPITDCFSALQAKLPNSVWPQKQAELLQDPRMQAVAKKIAKELEGEQITDSDIADPSSSFQRLTEKFRGAWLNHIQFNTSEGQIVLSWIRNMTAREFVSCFPDLVETMRAFKVRLEQARAETKKRQQEAAERAKQPVNVLGNAYWNYLMVKSCYEARIGYLAIYISDREMEQARDAVRTIEQALKPKLDPGVFDRLWGRVEARVREQNIPDKLLRYHRYTHDECLGELKLLLETSRRYAPNSGRVEKDF